jgi:hypothetical protein
MVTVLLVFTPGAIVAFLLNKSSLLKIDDAVTTVGIAVGLSVAFLTFVGYVVNFTPLGLNRLVPIVVAAPWAALGIYWIIRRSRFRTQLAWFFFFACLAVTVSIWALLSTGVAYTRNERSTEYIEFFLSSNPSDDNVFIVTIINRTKQPRNFSVVFRLAGSEVQVHGPRTCSPGSMLSEEFRLPLIPVGETLVISLEGDEFSGQELHLNNLGKTRARVVDRADLRFGFLLSSDLSRLVLQR